MNSAPLPPATDRFRTTTTVAAVFAAAAFFIAFVLATQLAMGVVGLSYLRWLGSGTSSGVTGIVEGVAAMLDVVGDATVALWSSGLARGALLIAAFIGGAIALHRARDFPWLRRVALGMSVLFIFLTALMLLMCGFRFALSSAFPLDEFVAVVLLSVVFCSLSLIPVYVYRLPWLCRVYALPFVILIAIQFALVILAPGPLTMDAKFGGNVALILMLAAVTGALVYAARLMRHLM